MISWKNNIIDYSLSLDNILKKNLFISSLFSKNEQIIRRYSQITVLFISDSFDCYNEILL